MELQRQLLAVERNLPFPLNRGYGLLRGLGHTASYKFGRSQALDNLIAQSSDREMERLEAAELVLGLGGSSDSEVERGELEAVKRFAEIHGATDQAQYESMDPSAPPEPLALKQLERIMDEVIPSPEPVPPAADNSAHARAHS